MSVVLPLPCYPYPVPQVVIEKIRVAKEALAARDGLDFKVQICAAMPGTPSRVLSFKGPTPFYADVAKLRNWEDPAELMFWIEWVLDEEKPVELGFSKADWMAYTIPGAVEVPYVPDPTEVIPGVHFF
jgi:hypothetical protein